MIEILVVLSRLMLEVTWAVGVIVYTASLLHLEPMMTSSKADPEMIVFLSYFLNLISTFISQVL